MVIRTATTHDIPAITSIYNEAILTTTATFDTETQSEKDRHAWFTANMPRYPIIVAELDGEVVGWAALTAWSKKPAYDQTAECSYYVKQAYQNQGIGKQLQGAIIECGRQSGFHTLIARVAEGSDASLHICKQCGFKSAGILRQVGFKFGKLLDVHLLQLFYDQRVGHVNSIENKSSQTIVKMPAESTNKARMYLIHDTCSRSDKR